MKKHTVIKRLSALVLALIMALSLALPAMASQTAPPYQINITPNNYTSKPSDLYERIKNTDSWADGDYAGSSNYFGWAQNELKDAAEPLTEDQKLAAEYINLVQRFKAFQIFSGNIDPGNYEQPNTPSDNTSIGNLPANALADVEWGDSVDNVPGLVTALVGSTIKLGDAGITPEMLLDESNTYASVLTAATKYQSVITIDESVWGSSGSEPEAYAEMSYAEALVTALQDDIDETLTLGDLFTAAGLSSENTSAALVAKALSDFTPSTAAGNPALARAFAKIVTERNSAGTGDYKYLTDIDDYTSSWSGAQWTIGGGNSPDDPLQGGYYLFTDTYDESHYGHTDKAQSELILGVFGTVNMTVKASAPSVDKGIVDGNNKANKGDAAEIGDTVTFRLTGTLPENYDTAYDEYKYIFHDTLSKGLTYGSVNQVYVKVYDEEGKFEEGNLKYDIYVIDAYDESDNPHGYQEKTGDGAKHTKGDGVEIQHTVDFNFQDLKKLQGRKATGIDLDGGYATGDGTDYIGVPITGSSEIYVEYAATLNKNAVVGGGENYNEVILEYSDNPENSKETNSSTGSRSYVYTFGVEILKYDGSKDGTPADNPLKDAGFALTKDVAEKWYQITNISPDAEPVEPPVTPQYTWIRESELKEILGDEVEPGTLSKDVHGGEKLSELNTDYDVGEYVDWYLVFDDDGPKTMESMTYYALLMEVDGSPKNHYVIAGWVPEVYLVDILDQNEKDGKISDAEWEATITGAKAAAYLSEGFTASDNYVLAIKTDEDGYLRVEGMDGGIVYYLREVVTPSGFDTIGPVDIQFTAEYFTKADLAGSDRYPTGVEAGMLKNLAYTSDALNLNDEKIMENGFYKDTADGTFTSETGLRIAGLEVPNYPAGWLPGAGGSGVYLFYIGGAALLVGAVVFLIFSNRKKPERRTR